MSFKTLSNATRRPLLPSEIALAKPIFGDSVAYSRVWIHEHQPLADWIDQAARALLRRPARPRHVHNAMAIGNHCLFPITLDIENHVGHREWLIHELTHIWQYQRRGWDYLGMAIRTHMREGDPYDFGGCEGLQAKHCAGWRFSDFNVEQQANIVQQYWRHCCLANDDPAPWLPFLEELR